MIPFSDAEATTIADFEKDTIEVQDSEPLLNIQFEHPAMVAPGEAFTFIIHLIKHPGFRPSGSITQYWPQGFLPREAALEQGTMNVKDRRVVIKWDKLPRHGQVSFSYPVDVMYIKGSTYPVITEYHDVVGVNLSRTTGLHVMEGEQEEEDGNKHEIQDVEELPSKKKRKRGSEDKEDKEDKEAKEEEEPKPKSRKEDPIHSCLTCEMDFKESEMNPLEIPGKWMCADCSGMTC